MLSDEGIGDNLLRGVPRKCNNLSCVVTRWVTCGEEMRDNLFRVVKRREANCFEWCRAEIESAEVSKRFQMVFRDLRRNETHEETNSAFKCKFRQTSMNPVQ